MNRRATQPSAAGSRLILVRHAHTEMAGTFCGLSDPPLSSRGISQLEALNQRLKLYPLTHIFSSDLQRARQTAESVAASCGLQVQYLSSLHELAFGSWEGLNWDQVMARDPEYAQRWLDLHPSVPTPGGEDFAEFLRRIENAMMSIAAQTVNGCTAVVTHAGVVRTFLGELAHANGTVLDLASCNYTSCWEVRRRNDQWILPRPITSSQNEASATISFGEATP